jgi:hypothetical protein
MPAFVVLIAVKYFSNSNRSVPCFLAVARMHGLMLVSALLGLYIRQSLEGIHSCGQVLVCNLLAGEFLETIWGFVVMRRFYWAFWALGVTCCDLITPQVPSWHSALEW